MKPRPHSFITWNRCRLSLHWGPLQVASKGRLMNITRLFSTKASITDSFNSTIMYNIMAFYKLQLLKVIGATCTRALFSLGGIMYFLHIYIIKEEIGRLRIAWGPRVYRGSQAPLPSISPFYFLGTQLVYFLLALGFKGVKLILSK